LHEICGGFYTKKPGAEAPGFVLQFNFDFIGIDLAADFDEPAITGYSSHLPSTANW
jgi:hypothetical protein